MTAFKGTTSTKGHSKTLWGIAAILFGIAYILWLVSYIHSIFTFKVIPDVIGSGSRSIATGLIAAILYTWACSRYYLHYQDYILRGGYKAEKVKDILTKAKDKKSYTYLSLGMWLILTMVSGLIGNYLFMTGALADGFNQLKIIGIAAALIIYLFWSVNVIEMLHVKYNEIDGELTANGDDLYLNNSYQEFNKEQLTHLKKQDLLFHIERLSRIMDERFVIKANKDAAHVAIAQKLVKTTKELIAHFDDQTKENTYAMHNVDLDELIDTKMDLEVEVAKSMLQLALFNQTDRNIVLDIQNLTKEAETRADQTKVVV